MNDDATMLHATTVAVDGRGILIIGPSGAGKSALALQLIALGALLVSDDRTIITRSDDVLMASAPTTIAGLIEARGVGLIPVKPSAAVPLRLVIDMSQAESQRLPESHLHEICDVAIPCLYKVEAPHFPSAVLLYARATG